MREDIKEIYSKMTPFLELMKDIPQTDIPAHIRTLTIGKSRHVNKYKTHGVIKGGDNTEEIEVDKNIFELGHILLVDKTKQFAKVIGISKKTIFIECEEILKQTDGLIKIIGRTEPEPNEVTIIWQG